jgi:negative regulator of sigma-B (phosphoserine phosphatase)
MSPPIPSLVVAQKVRSRRGEVDCGDAVVSMRGDEAAVLALIDGLGHGEHAAAAARAAVAALQRQKADTSMEARFLGVHESVRDTRGVAMTIVVITKERLVAAGVGNVALRVSQTKLPYVATAGILGSAYVRPRVASAPLVPNTRIVLHSDGVSPRFSLLGVSDLDASAACEAIFESRASVHDDAAIVVADVSSL